MTLAAAGRYVVREATSAQDRDRAFALRARCFGQSILQDPDPFDAAARQFVIEAHADGRLVCSFRLTAQTGASLGQSYAGRVYDLGALRDFAGTMLELGRFCIAPDSHDPDILRLAWGRLAREVDAQRAALLFGCSSFSGVTAQPYRDAFGLLHARHLAPTRWQPGVAADEVIPLAPDGTRPLDLRAGQRTLPPLLRSYLTMGGWVSDHAVVDRQLNTLHVFTGLEIAAIPEGRKRLLRALA